MLVARCCAVARRRRRAALILGAASIARLPPTNHRRRPPRGDRPLPHPAPHRRLAQVAHPAGRSRMLIAVHGAARPPAAAATSASSFHEKNSAKKNRRRRPAGGTSGSVGSRVAPLTDGDGSARPSRAREDSARVWLICPTKLLIVQCRVFGDDPVAEPRCAAASRSSNISIIDVAVWRRVSCWSHAAARWPVVAGARR